MPDPDAMILPAERLSANVLMRLLQAATDRAAAMGQPQCIVVAGVSAVELAPFRLARAEVLSLRSARSAPPRLGGPGSGLRFSFVLSAGGADN